MLFRSTAKRAAGRLPLPGERIDVGRHTRRIGVAHRYRGRLAGKAGSPYFPLSSRSEPTAAILCDKNIFHRVCCEAPGFARRPCGKAARVKVSTRKGREAGRPLCKAAKKGPPRLPALRPPRLVWLFGLRECERQRGPIPLQITTRRRMKRQRSAAAPARPTKPSRWRWRR